MTTQPGQLTDAQTPTDSSGRVTVGTGAVLLAVAAAHQAAQNALIERTVRAILAVWGQMSFFDMSRAWQLSGPRIYGYLSVAQEIAAAEAAGYVQHALAVQGITIDMPPIVPRTFAGTAGDGRSLEGLLLGTVVKAKESIGRGKSESEARADGAAFLQTVVRTEVADAGRSADQVALVVAQRKPAATTAPKAPAAGMLKTDEGRKVRYGWIRMLTPPSCGRCAILAGRFYKWNDGFERHPNCDCRHIPVEENVAGDITTDPKAYFDSLSPEDQEKFFGVANSKAIRDGGDIGQVMNAALRKGGVYTADNGRRYTREGTTRRGFYGSRKAGRSGLRRPTPVQIYRDARGDQDAAIRLLKQFGYIVG